MYDGVQRFCSYAEMTTRSGKQRRIEEPSDSKDDSLPPATPTRPATRTSTEIWLIGHPSASITGAKLPDCRQVMKYYMYLRNDPDNIRNKVKNEEIAYDVVDNVIVFWNMARIKTKYRHHCMSDVMKLWNEWQGLMKNKGRQSDPGNKRANFVARLDTLFDIGAPDAIEAIMKSRLLSAKKKQDDVDFYLDQKHERRASMDGHDKIFETKAEMLLARQAREARIREREENRAERQRETAAEGAACLLELDSYTQMSEGEECQELDPDFEVKLPDDEKPADTEFVSLRMPKKIMQCDEITSAADRLKLSDNQATMLVSAVIKASGGNLDDFDISRSTTHRSRMCNRQQVAENAMAEVTQNPPLFCALHWDGKLLSDVLGDSYERLAVLLSGAPQYIEGKLLGVPSLVDSKGMTQANATYDLLEVWDISDRVAALVFDTTASNSGVHKGAAKLIEERLGRKLLYLACRHHILEVIVGSVWKLLFGAILGPENKLFAQFKQAWKDIDKEIPVQTLTVKDPWLLQVRNQVVKDLVSLLSSEEDSATFPRDDYRECVENTLIIFGETPPRGIHFMKPGAIHQARWMANNLYVAKMFMFSKALLYDDEMVDKLMRMNRFLALFYTSAWMKASSGADAPANDLQLIHDMIDFREVDKALANTVIDKLSNHRWYLTEEVVPFALFSKHRMMTDCLKQEMAIQLVATPVPENFRLGKPVFRKVARDTTLKDLIGPESHTLFRILNVSTDWLVQPVDQWSSNPAFLVAEEFVRTVKVVNDAAERGVKLISDFATIITTDPAQRSWLLQGVEQHRRQFPTFDKKTLNMTL